MRIDCSFNLAFERYVNRSNIEEISETDLLLGFPVTLSFTLKDREIYKIEEASALGFLGDLAFGMKQLGESPNSKGGFRIPDVDGTYILVFTLKGQIIEIFDEMKQEKFQVNWSDFRNAVRTFALRLLSDLEAQSSLQKNSYYPELRKSIEIDLEF